MNEGCTFHHIGHQSPMKTKENLFLRRSPTPCMWPDPTSWAAIPRAGISPVTWWCHMKGLVSRNWALNISWTTRPGQQAAGGSLMAGSSKPLAHEPFLLPMQAVTLKALAKASHSLSARMRKDVSAVLGHSAITTLMPKRCPQR